MSSVNAGASSFELPPQACESQGDSAVRTLLSAPLQSTAGAFMGPIADKEAQGREDKTLA